jgi:hypothetical protein
MGQWLYAQILHDSDKHIGGWDAAGECPGAADTGGDDSTSFSILGFVCQGADSGGEGAFGNCGKDSGSADAKNAKREVQLCSRDEDGTESWKTVSAG